MKTIGLIGGMSWTSSLDYYRLLNEEVQSRLGGLHSARCILSSFDFEDIRRLEHVGARTELEALLIDAARRLEAAGADCLLICANTQHRSAEVVQAAAGVPLIHIADATGAEARRLGLTHVGLLGTRYTMEEGFYKERLAEKYGLQVSVPDEPGRDLVHRTIYEELCRDIIRPESEQAVLGVIDSLVERGAEAAILGCTELPLLIKQAPVPLLSTTAIHAKAAVEFALG